MLEKTLESPLDCKQIKPVNPKGNQSLIFIGRTDAEAEAPVLWLPDAKSWLTGKDPDAGKDWGHEKGMREDRMVGWHHRLNGQEFEETPGDSERQGRLIYCSPWGHRELNMAEWLNNSNHKIALMQWNKDRIQVIYIPVCHVFSCVTCGWLLACLSLSIKIEIKRLSWSKLNHCCSDKVE